MFALQILSRLDLVVYKFFVVVLVVYKYIFTGIYCLTWLLFCASNPSPIEQDCLVSPISLKLNIPQTMLDLY